MTTSMKFVIGNWKMKLDDSASAALAEDVKRLVGAWIGETDVRVVVCPSYLALGSVSRALSGSSVAFGGQNVFWEDEGAYTGEISPVELSALGCGYCIVGHSERRKHLGETDEMVNKKVKSLLGHGLVPIVCVGETKDERQSGRRDAVVIGQVKAALEGVELGSGGKVIVAYEPRWVIGTGKAVDPGDAEEMHRLIRTAVNEMLGEDALRDGRCFVLYGGSVDSSNIRGFLEVPVIDGVLVGGASLKSDEFQAMVSVAAGRDR